MTHVNPAYSSDVLVEDFLTVQQAIASPTLGELQRKIIAGNATDRDIETHYRTFDAIDTPTVFESELGARRYVKTAGSIAMADFIGGAQMVAGQLVGATVARNGGYDGILPTLLTEDALPLVMHQIEKGNLADEDISDWNTIATYTHETEAGPLRTLAERVGSLHYMRMIGAFEDDVMVTNEESLRAISLGRTILHEGVKGFRSYLGIQPGLYVDGPSETAVARSLVEVVEDPNLQVGLSGLILRSGGVLVSKVAKEILLDEVKRSTGPGLSWPTRPSTQLAAEYVDGTEVLDIEFVSSLQDALFVDAVNNIQVVANFARQSDPDMFKKGRIKGNLHEALWMLDAFALRKGMPERYGDLFVHVSTEAEDMPYLDKPQLKRGYDFVIEDNGGAGKRRLIQVGASSRKVRNETESGYHPEIELYCEKEFNEVNLTTLENKLQMYREWAADGFSEAAFARLKIAENLLGTVKACFRLSE